MVKKSNYSGYAALVTVLVVMSIIVIVTISVSLLSISEGQLAISDYKSSLTSGVADSCVSEALLRLNEDGNIPSSITLPEGVCDVTINSNNGTTWDFTVSSSNNGHKTKINVIATRGNTVTIDKWQIID